MQDLINKKFNELIVVEYSHKKGNKHYWKCVCSCGKYKIVETHNLINGNSKSCGAKIHRINNLVGNVYGRLTVISYSHSNENNKTYWLCRCNCGKDIVVRSDSLKEGNTKSCGCLNFEGKRFTHSQSKSKLYHVWATCKDRCNNINNKNYIHYGERGIKMCEEWEFSYEKFHKWAINNGYLEGLTLERIDVNKGYSPDNCCWITQSEQCNNTRRNRKIEYRGEVHNINQWAEILNINKNTLWYRINNNWDLDRAFRK